KDDPDNEDDERHPQKDLEDIEQVKYQLERRGGGYMRRGSFSGDNASVGEDRKSEICIDPIAKRGFDKGKYRNDKNDRRREGEHNDQLFLRNGNRHKSAVLKHISDRHANQHQRQR